MKSPVHSPQSTVPTQDLLAAAAACDRAAAAETEEQGLRAVMEIFAHREAIQLALLNQQLDRVAGARPEERLPLRDEGDDLGVVEARIPKRLFWHLQQQSNFVDGLWDDGGMRDFLKKWPMCRVKTVSGKTTVSGIGVPPVSGRGKTGRMPVPLTVQTHRQTGRMPVPLRRVHFARGTLNLAT